MHICWSLFAPTAPSATFAALALSSADDDVGLFLLALDERLAARDVFFVAYFYSWVLPDFDLILLDLVEDAFGEYIENLLDIDSSLG